jgi:hypothetical protein
MNKRLLPLVVVFLLAICVSSNALAGPRITKVDRVNGTKVMMPGDFRTAPFTFYDGPGIVLQGEVYGDSYIIGPEQLITGLSGFYDWQTNGDSKHHLYRHSSTVMHAVYMTSQDSTAADPNRRSSYSFSQDDGTNWTSVGDVPTGLRSGYPYVTATEDGAAVIANHYNSPLNSYVHVDALAGLGSFTTTRNTVEASVWPQVNRLTNGNILVVGNSYQNGAATDTIIAQVFNPTTNSFSNLNRLMTNASSQVNMRWASATGPNGRAVIAVVPISDVGGSFGQNRGFYFTSTDNGATWSSAQMFFDSFVSGTDTNTVWLGVDAAYDNTGNFYIAYNTAGALVTSATIWVSKNGTPGVKVASNMDITGAAQGFVTTQANAISMDWPSLSVSDDGLFVFCTYTVFKDADTVNGFNSGDIYYSVSPTTALAFSSPVQVSSGINDERYSSIHRVALTSGSDTYKLFMTYQKDPQGGSSSFSDNAPVSRASLVKRVITQAQIVGINNIGSEVPNRFSLSQNYPNPFNPATSIRFAIPQASIVTLKVYNVNGQEVATLVNNQTVTAGVKEVSFDASKLSSGVYFYTLSAGDFRETKKMTLIK